MTDGVTKLTRMIEENAMPTVVSNSVPAMKWICEAIALIFIIIVSMVFVSRDLEKIKERQKKFVFYKEFSELYSTTNITQFLANSIFIDIKIRKKSSCLFH